MEVLKPFLQRLSQPIILSFCIAWIFWNWQIVIGLLWYNSETICLYGYKNYKDLIYQNAKWQHNYLYPLVIAVAFPYIRYGLNWINAFVRTKEKTKLLEISGTGKLSTLRFLELKKSYDDRLFQMSQYIDEEAKIKTDLNNYATLLDQKTAELKTLQDKISFNDKIIENHNNQISDQEIEIKTLKSHLEFSQQARKIYDTQFRNSFSHEHIEFYKKYLDKFPEINKTYTDLNRDNQYEVFLNVFNFVTKGGSIDQDSLSKMAKLHLILIDERGSEYLTPLAIIIYNILNYKD